MCRLTLIRTVLLGCAMLAAARSPAQERRPHVGVVRTADGKPLANATVQFAWVPSMGEDQVAADHPTATTDERGRFRAELLPCAHYRVWTTGPITDGAYLASEVAWTAVGRSLELVAAHPQQTGRWTMQNLDGWRDRGPLRVRFLPDLVELPKLTMTVGEDGRFVGPALPTAMSHSSPLCLELLAADGSVLDARQAMPATQPETTIAWTDTRELMMRVVDGAGAPVPGATLRQRVPTGWSPGDSLRPAPAARQTFRDLGATGADGTLAARIACAEDPFQQRGWRQLFFVATKPGFAASFSGFSEHTFLDGKEVEQYTGKELRFTLVAEQPLRVQIGIGERPLADAPWTVHANVPVHNQKGNGWTHESMMWHTRTDAAGVTAVADLPTSTRLLTLRLGGDVRVRELVPEAQRGWLAPEPVLLHRVAPTQRNLHLDLATFRPLQLRVLDENQAPARAVSLLLLSLQGEALCDARTPQPTTDSAGRCTVLLQPGRWFVFARTELAMAQLEIDAGQESGPSERTLQLTAMPRMFGKVVDGQGKPIAGAALDCDGMSRSGQHRQALGAVVEVLGWSWFRSVRTDSDGNFVCGLAPVPGMRHEGSFRVGQRASTRFAFEAVTEPLTIVVP